MSNFYAQYPASSSGSNASVGGNGAPAPTSSTEVGFINGSGNLTGVGTSNPLPVTISSGIANPLPVQDAAAESSLSSLVAKTGSSDVTVAYDYRSFSYVAATTRIDTIVYKSGGSGGTTVATQTFGYDGSDRLTSITKT